MRTVYIYALHELGGPPRYIGKTVDPASRLKSHRKERTQTHKCRWIHKIGSDNVFMSVLEKTTEDQASYRERQLIAMASKLGWSLTNGTAGGDGLQNPTPETRRKMSDSAKRANADPSLRIKRSSASKMNNYSHRMKGQMHWLYGVHRTEEQRKKISASQMGRTSPMLGKIQTETTRQKISASLKGRKLSAEHRQRISLNWKGRNNAH